MAITGQPATRINLDIVASAGASRTVTFQIADANGTAVTGWESGDTLTVQVWRGDDYAVLTGIGVTSAWSSAPNGTVSVTTDGTHTLDVQKYAWRLLAANGGKTYEVARGAYEILPSPGSVSNAADPANDPYTTIDDLRTVCNWIEEVQSTHDQAGLMEHQRNARVWFDDAVKAGFLSCGASYTRPIGMIGVPWLGDLDAVPQWLTEVLASGSGIELTPQVKRACALYACYSALSSQITTKDDANAYRRMAAAFRASAANEVATMTVNVKSSTASTTYDVSIHLNRFSRY